MSMTVAELVQHLTDFMIDDPKYGDRVVLLEGCDCVGEWDGVFDVTDTLDRRPAIMLCRKD